VSADPFTNEDSSRPVDPQSAASEMVDRLREGVLDDADKRKATKSFWRELPILIVVALVVAVIIKTFFIQAFYIPSGSMEPTLEVGDRVMVNKLSYRFGDPSRGDVIVFDSPFEEEEDRENILEAALRNIGESLGISSPRSDFIKRVIALPGEVLEIRDGQVLIDGQILNEPYLKPNSTMEDLQPTLIPEGNVWVMGDNRRNSQDSRVFDSVSIDTIVGRAFVIVWPPDRWGGL
jgi:signal peptidase I